VYRIVVGSVIATVLGVAATTLERTYDIPEDLKKYSAPFPDGVLEKIEAAQLSADQRNLALVGGLIGAAVCVCLGAAVTSGNPAKGVVTGAVLGGLLGGAGGAVSASAFRHFILNPLFPGSPFLDGVAAQGSLTVLVALALGLTVLVASSKTLKSETPAVIVVVGLVASAMYPLLSAMAFPLMKSQQAIPEGMGNRGLWIGLPVALFAVTLIRSRRPSSADAADVGSN
jgi:hypothetical protein